MNSIIKVGDPGWTTTKIINNEGDQIINICEFNVDTNEALAYELEDGTLLSTSLNPKIKIIDNKPVLKKVTVEDCTVIHDLETINPSFQYIWDGLKTFEIRKFNRPFRVGHYISLREYIDEKYTNRSIIVQISYILYFSPDILATIFGESEEYCIMSIKLQ